MQAALDRTSLHEKKSKTLFTKNVEFKKSKREDEELPKLIRHTKEQLAPIRNALPIADFRDAIIHAVETNQNIVVVGETGSGKTTQVPQYLYEAGLVPHDPSINGAVAITQPRRVAAITLADRVSQEVGTALGDAVGYTVRFDDTSSSSTKLKFLTDGMLLRELQIDPKLGRYKIIVLDEAHERTLSTDVLFGLLKTLQQTTRPDLKLVVMSATLDADKFSSYLNNCPVALIPGRTHPVDVYYLDRDTIEEEFEKDSLNLTDSNDLVVKTVMQIHQDKPLDGDILVFMPGSDDIESVKEVLSDRVDLLIQKHKEQQEALWVEYMAKSISTRGVTSTEKGDMGDKDGNGIKSEAKPDSSSTSLFATEPDETAQYHSMNDFLASIGQEPPAKLHILPLYSTLAPELQLQAFNPAPEGTRKVILSTNIAETSVTVSGVKYVIDTGLAKQKLHIHGTGVGSLHSQVISRAEAQQRTGRAGREQPGECYRLYTEEAFETEWRQTPIPEIARAPLSGTILNLLALKIDILKFPLIDTPSIDAIKAGYKELIRYNAIYNNAGVFQLTELGRLMSTFPIEPVYSRLLILSSRPELLWLTEMPDLSASHAQSQADANAHQGHKNYGMTKKSQLEDLKSTKKFLQELTFEKMAEKLGKDRGDLDLADLCQPCSEEMCIMIAALSVENLVKSISDSPSTRVLKYKVEALQQEHGSKYGDLFFYFTVLRQFLFFNTHEKRVDFCHRYYYNYRNLNQALKVYQQLCELLLESHLPLVSSLHQTHPKRAYTYAQFLRNGANRSEDKDEPGQGDKKKKQSQPTRSALVQLYLNENQPSYSFRDDEYDFDKMSKKAKESGSAADETKEEEVEWEENMAKCLTSGFYDKLSVMDESSKFHEHTSGKKVDIHPSSTLNGFVRKEMDEWKEKKKAKQASNAGPNGGRRVKDLQQYNASAKQSGALQDANIAKTGQGVPHQFKDYTAYSHLCFTELIDTSKLYMRGCFLTNKHWLEIFSCGVHKFESVESLVDQAAHGASHDEANSQVNNSHFGKRSAHSNLTGKTLAHTVGLGAGQKALGLKKTVIDGQTNSVQIKSTDPTQPSSQMKSKLAIGIGTSASHQNKKQANNQSQSASASHSSQKFVQLSLDSNPTKFKKGK